MQSINKVILIGRVGTSPEVLTFGNSKIAKFSLATSETWKDKSSGERKESTEWHNIVVTSPSLAKFVESYVNKGDALYVEGKVKTRKYKDKKDETVSITEIVLAPFASNLFIVSGKKAEHSPEQD